MKKEPPIYVIGHKNPDTDSICSAIAYADLKRRTEDGEFIAARAGQMNEETEYVLSRFQVNPPIYISDVGTQVKDMEIRQTPGTCRDISIKDAWAIMKKTEAVTLPVTTEEGELAGIVTTGDIAKSYMDAHDSRFLSKAGATFQNIADTVGGTILVGDGSEKFCSGKVIVGAAHPDTMETYLEKGDMVLLGNRYEDHLRAVESGAGCLIICVDAKPGASIQRIARRTGCTVITTAYDTFTVARLINQSIPLSAIMRQEGLITFKTDDYTEDIREVMANTRHRAFPVIDKGKKYVGTISRRNFIGIQKKKLILVDHNEQSQAVDNLQQAQILEIIDHHKVGAPETVEPIYFRNQPVGCTATIVYQMYQEKGLQIDPDIAGLLCSAILSDTLLFRSPTCTPLDRAAAERLAAISGIKTEPFAMAMFRAGSNLLKKTPEEIFYQDFKKFIAEEEGFGVGQISSVDQQELQEIKAKLLPFMEQQCGKKGISMVFFMLTDILEESTELLCVGADSRKLAGDAFDGVPVEMGYILPGVVSRKKQLIPAFMETLKQMKRPL